MKKSQLGSAGIVMLLIVGVSGLIASGTIDNTKLAQGKVSINKEVVEKRTPVDYSKLNK